MVVGLGAAAQGVKPVSVSYENLVRCFPVLQDKKLSFKVDLNRLKELIDEKFVTVHSQLRQRRVVYDNDRQTFILTQRNKFRNGMKVETLLSLQKLDDKGLYTDIKLPESQRINPKQEVINSFLANMTIKADDYSYYDTKLKGVHSAYKVSFKDVQEIELVDGPNKRSVLCEKQQMGIICTCSKK